MIFDTFRAAIGRLASVEILPRTSTPRHDDHFTANSSNEPFTPSFIGVRTQGNVIALSYPADCTNKDFRREYYLLGGRLAAAENPFQLVHDLRKVNVLSLPLRDIIADATAIARHGKVERVAFVLDVSPVVRRAIQAGLYMCPVQPARLFTGDQDAIAWAGEGDKAPPRLPDDLCAAAAARVRHETPLL